MTIIAPHLITVGDILTLLILGLSYLGVRQHILQIEIKNSRRQALHTYALKAMWTKLMSDLPFPTENDIK